MILQIAYSLVHNLCYLWNFNSKIIYMSIFGSILGGIGSAVLGGFQSGVGTAVGNAVSGNLSTKDYLSTQLKNQQTLNEEAYERQLEFWNMQNAYNDPSAVVQRLRKAGLNPALAYGGSSVTPAGQLSNVNAGSAGGGNRPNIDPTTFATLRNVESQTKLNEAQANKVDAEANLANEKINTEKSVQQLNQSTKALQDAMTTNTTLKNDWQIIVNDLANMTKYDRAEQISTHVQETIARTHKIYSELNLDQQKSKQIQREIQLTIARTLLTGVEAEARRADIQLTEAQTTEAWQNVSNMITMQELYFPEAKAMQEWSKVVYPVISGLYTAIKDVFGDKPESNGFTAGQVLKLLYGIANAD